MISFLFSSIKTNVASSFNSSKAKIIIPFYPYGSGGHLLKQLYKNFNLVKPSYHMRQNKCSHVVFVCTVAKRYKL